MGQYGAGNGMQLSQHEHSPTAYLGVHSSVIVLFVCSSKYAMHDELAAIQLYRSVIKPLQLLL